MREGPGFSSRSRALVSCIILQSRRTLIIEFALPVESFRHTDALQRSAIAERRHAHFGGLAGDDDGLQRTAVVEGKFANRPGIDGQVNGLQRRAP